MRWREAPPAFRIYLAILCMALPGAILFGLTRVAQPEAHVIVWIALSLLLAASEFMALSFHGQDVRFSLSGAEAILLPMVVTLSLPQLVLGATIANAIARPMRWRISPAQEMFNVAQYGCAAALAGVTWQALQQGSGFTVQNAASAAVSVLVFAFASHLLVAMAVTLARGVKFTEFLWAINATSFGLNLAGNISFGLLFAAAYFAAAWTIVLFALPLAALYFGYRAILRQQREKQRVEHLHAASRSLASSPDLGHSIIGFLNAVAGTASSAEARAIVALRGQLLCWAVRDGETTVHGEPLVEGWLSHIFDEVRRERDALIIGKDEAETAYLDLPAQTLLAVPLLADGEVIGCIAVLDRLGPEGFKEADAFLLDALGAELAVTIDSYRLFAQVEEERARFARIFNGSTEGICLIDSDAIVRAWNPALERISGYSAEEMVGRRWSDVVMIRNHDQLRIEGTDVVNVSSDDELELVTRGGPTRWVSLLAGPTQTADDPGWVLLVRDVSAAHELESAKSDFLSTISHELRTPLTTIKGSLQVLERGPDRLPADLASQMIGVTTRGAERLERLVMNLLVVSQIESGVLPVFLEEVALDDVVLERIGIMLRDHERLEIVQKDQKLTVRGDRERIGQAIEHVLDNALKFGGAEGLITIEIERKNGYAHVAITDEGPGIAQADHDKIWERFSRLGDVLTRETQGAGVGLFIAKRSIDALEGELWVDSEPGRGSTFHLTIPLAHPLVVVQAAEPA